MLFTRFLVTWAVFFGLYLMFAGQLSASELGIGVFAGAAIATFSLILWRHESRSLGLGAPWPRLILSPLFALPADSWRAGRVLLNALWRKPMGEIGARQKQPFQHGDDTPRAAGRRALATLAVSFAPNGYVLDITDNENDMLIHRLHPTGPKADMGWPL